ncbi:MAG: caspase family protein, partial [Planctomycetales bacterium]|nr:caspase family protein [Planctomycetales bacterium]MBN8627758.1 caspase family protein [Planctomycetota bacterium]
MFRSKASAGNFEVGARPAGFVRRVAAVAFALTLISVRNSAALSAPPAPLRPDAPVAILIAAKDYPRQPLKNSVASTVKLATALSRNGYGVTLVTDAPLDDQTRAELPQVAAENLRTAATAAEIEAVIDGWLTRHFGDKKNRASFGLCCFSGHGETRLEGTTKVPYFLARDDESGSGGVNLNQVKSKIGESWFPVVMLVDTCRTPSEAAVESPEAGAKRKRLSTKEAAGLSQAELVNALRTSPVTPIDADAVVPVTTLWATTEGEEADDEVDFFSLLAEGLEPGTSDRTMFRAREYRGAGKQIANRDAALLESEADLSLYTWFVYAASLSQLAHEFQYNCTIDEGYVAVTMLCASLNKKKVLGPPDFNLTYHLRFPFVGGLAVQRNAHGLSYSAPAQRGYGAAFFAEPIEWAGMSLGLELTPTRAGARPGEVLDCLLQPGDNLNGTFLSAEWNVARALPYNQTTRILVPLEGTVGQAFTSLAISTDPANPAGWPRDAAVTVSQILLVNNQTGQVVQRPVAVGEVDLLSRWWDKDVLTKHDGAVVTCRREKSGSQRKTVLSITDAPLAGIGGILYAAPFLDKTRRQLEVVVGDIRPRAAAAKNAEVTLTVWSEDRELASVVLKRSGRQVFPITDSGFPEYLSIVGSDAATIELSRVALVPVGKK